jgi:hypothetical protein
MLNMLLPEYQFNYFKNAKPSLKDWGGVPNFAESKLIWTMN